MSLKTVLLSWYGFVHVQSFVSCQKGLSTWAEMVGMAQSPSSSVKEEDEKSPRQNHMLGCLKGFNLSMLYICGVALFLTDDGVNNGNGMGKGKGKMGGTTATSSTSLSLRDHVLIAEGVMYAVTAYDAYTIVGLTKFLPAYIVPAVLSVVAVFVR